MVGVAPGGPDPWSSLSRKRKPWSRPRRSSKKATISARRARLRTP